MMRTPLNAFKKPQHAVTPRHLINTGLDVEAGVFLGSTGAAFRALHHKRDRYSGGREPLSFGGDRPSVFATLLAANVTLAATGAEKTHGISKTPPKAIQKGLCPRKRQHSFLLYNKINEDICI